MKLILVPFYWTLLRRKGPNFSQIYQSKTENQIHEPVIEIQLDEDVSSLVTRNVTEPVEIPVPFQENGSGLQ